MKYKVDIHVIPRPCRSSHEERGLKLDRSGSHHQRAGRSSHEERGLKSVNSIDSRDRLRRSSHEERGLKCLDRPARQELVGSLLA